MFYSNKENKKQENKKCDATKINEKTVPNNDNQISQNKDAMNLVKPIQNKTVSLEATVPTPSENSNQLVPQKIPLPQVDITANNSEKLITNLMRKTDPVVKYINSQKCAYASCKVLLGDSNMMDYHIESHWNDGFKCLECQVGDISTRF